MKKKILIALVVVLALAATASLVWANPVTNLLSNPGAESGMTPWTWTGPVGSVLSQGSSTGTVLPRSGSRFFNMAMGPGASASMSQNVDVTGMGTFCAGGWIQTEWYPKGTSQTVEDNDNGKLTVQFFDGGAPRLGA